MLTMLIIMCNVMGCGTAVINVLDYRSSPRTKLPPLGPTFSLDNGVNLYFILHICAFYEEGTVPECQCTVV